MMSQKEFQRVKVIENAAGGRLKENREQEHVKQLTFGSRRMRPRKNFAIKRSLGDLWRPGIHFRSSSEKLKSRGNQFFHMFLSPDLSPKVRLGQPPSLQGVESDLRFPPL
jgi:hypothetical protein